MATMALDSSEGLTISKQFNWSFWVTDIYHWQTVTKTQDRQFVHGVHIELRK